MQCQSYFPVFRSHYDLNVDANGGATATPVYNGNGTFGSGHYNDYVSPSPVRGGPFAYKELLRQTMLMHEVTFKDQVQELHRLYRRQKEMMGEIKSKELYINHLPLEVQSSTSSSAIISARCGENTLHSRPFINSHCPPYSTGRDNIQAFLSSVKEPIPPVSPIASRNGDILNYMPSAESKVKKIKGKLLDLELPAEVYIDSDEEELLDDLEFVKAPTPATNKRSKVVVGTDVSASSANGSSEHELLGELPSFCSFSGNKTNLADLNEPLEISYLEESGRDKRTNSCVEISEINHDLSNSRNTTSHAAADKQTMISHGQSGKAKPEAGSASSSRKSSIYLGQSPLVVQGLPSFNSQLSSSKGAKICSRQKGTINKKADVSPRCSPNRSVEKSLKSSCSESKSKDSVVCMSPTTPNLNCIDLNSATVANLEFTPPGDISCCKTFTKVEILEKFKRCRMIDINLPCDPATDEESLVQDDSIGHDYENPSSVILDFCMDDDGLQPKSSSLAKTPSEVDLEAPISPEVEERSPPRGDSEENQSEEDGNHFEELAKIAAEAIISISLSKSPSYTASMCLQKCEPSDGGNLEWFAGLICSFSSDPENDFEVINCKNTSNIDDYEAMTLELTETKVEDYCCRISVQNASDTCSMLLPCQTRKGRTRRSKRKDFQREILPSLASLSRYEVTEDIQMIEGLMEAAGTPWNLSRTRRTCRMGRKPRMVKQPDFDDEVPELRTLIRWDNVNRRPRGRRRPASPTVLSKWVEYAI
ncbi:hypothetical protein BVRB_5g114040 [Beta vulgaris subsp. vulgaris]|nr:hypothetical protein BVRB_5g114040 [Beta vulgaris subsp. vulgaris]